MAMDKPIAIIKSKDTGKVFDVDNMLRVFTYDQTLWKSAIEKDLKDLIDHLKGT